MQCNNLIIEKKKKPTSKLNKQTSQQITKGNALNGEKEFPPLLKFPFTIQRGSNILFISILSCTNEMKSLKTNIVLFRALI